MFKFKCLHQSKKSKARVGEIQTSHGVIRTPNFVPVATNGTLKGVDNQILNQLDSDLIFCNTYHLALHPGGDVIEGAGGLHHFIGRNKPIITDSGGFQVFSLAYGSVANELKSKGSKQTGNAVLGIDETGVRFRSYRDGSIFVLTPEKSVQLQKQLGADIIIPFDELPPFHCDHQTLKRSLARTHRWQIRSHQAHMANPKHQAMYAVIHGGIVPAFRQESCQILTKVGFDGYAVGGSLGKNVDDLDQVLSVTIPHLPDDAPRHLLGIADQAGIACGVTHGMDTFDSCYPAKMARHGVLLTKHGRLKITAGRYKADFNPIELDCVCPSCQHYSRGFIHHCFKAKEPIAISLATVHNMAAMFALMADYRQAISEDRV